jgi:cytidylate kinase
MIVTIDGGAGVGKSTAAKLVAQKLGFEYIDTGATYRAVGYKCKKLGVNPEDEKEVEKVVKSLRIKIKNHKIFLNEEDITEVIKDEEIGKWASTCSKHKKVRERMVSLQRKLAKGKKVVCEGRDIGTVVFPQAEVKIYMKADPNVRAIRRKKELGEMGIYKSVEEIKESILKRDEQDKSRKYAPLKIPKGAKIVDTTNLSIKEMVEEILKIIKNASNI